MAKNRENGLKRAEMRGKLGEIDENGIMAGVNYELREFREWGLEGKGAG